jgi:hypothetical protein
VRAHPVATKRHLRAILEGCRLAPSRAKRSELRLLDEGFTVRYEYALQTLTESRLIASGCGLRAELFRGSRKPASIG